MNLSGTLQALEVRNITIAIDLGAHQYCLLDSNCPKAIELRRLIEETGMTLVQLLEGFQAVNAPDPISFELPQFSADTSITIGGQTLYLDFNQVVDQQLRRMINRKLEEIEQLGTKVRILGRSLYESYLHEINRIKYNRVLPQLSFPLEELIKANCMITTDNDNYQFLFITKYNPQYIVRDGIRYRLSSVDTAYLVREPVFLQFIITPQGKLLSATLLDSGGVKFQHYHGRTSDCWGTAILLTTWDRTLSSLYRLSVSLMNSLATINYNSPVQREPPSMCSIRSLLDNCTELGREGELEPQEVVHQEEAPARRRTWGGRR